jgi:hypothetical protein
VEQGLNALIGIIGLGQKFPSAGSQLGEAAFRLLEKSLGDAKMACARFKLDVDTGGQRSSGWLEGFDFLALRRVAVEKRPGGGLQRCGFSGFVRCGENIEAVGERTDANRFPETTNMREFQGVKDHEATS